MRKASRRQVIFPRQKYIVEEYETWFSRSFIFVRNAKASFVCSAWYMLNQTGDSRHIMQKAFVTKKQPSRKAQKRNTRASGITDKTSDRIRKQYKKASGTKKRSTGKFRKQSVTSSITKKQNFSEIPERNSLTSGTRKQCSGEVQKQRIVTSETEKRVSGKIQNPRTVTTAVKRRPSRIVNKKKVWGSKQVLSSPFSLTFPSAAAGTKTAVLKLFAQYFPEPLGKRNQRPSLKTLTDERAKSRTTEVKSDERGQRKKPLRLLLGINETTRALEHKNVELVVVSRDVTPAFLVTHIPVLCFLKCAGLVVLSGNGTELGHILGTRRLLALCILMKPSTSSEVDQSIDELVEKLKPYCSELDYKWLAAIRGQTTPCLPDPSMVPHRRKEDILATLPK